MSHNTVCETSSSLEDNDSTVAKTVNNQSSVSKMECDKSVNRGLCCICNNAVTGTTNYGAHSMSSSESHVVENTISSQVCKTSTMSGDASYFLSSSGAIGGSDNVGTDMNKQSSRKNTCSENFQRSFHGHDIKSSQFRSSVSENDLSFVSGSHGGASTGSASRMVHSNSGRDSATSRLVNKTEKVKGDDKGTEINHLIHNILQRFPKNSDAVNSETTEHYRLSKDSKNYQVKHEVPVFVPKVEIHEIVREVPEVEVEYVDKVVEVPKIEYVDIYEEVEHVEYIKKEVEKIQIVEVPVQVVKRVPKIKKQYVDRIVRVKAEESTPRAKPLAVEAEFVVPHFSDCAVAVPLEFEKVPVISESSKIHKVDVARYVPHLVPIDVFVPKMVQLPVKDLGVTQTEQVDLEDVSSELLQKLTLEMNYHLISAHKFNQAQYVRYCKLLSESKDVCVKYNFDYELIKQTVMADYEKNYSESNSANLSQVLNADFFSNLPGFSVHNSGSICENNRLESEEFLVHSAMPNVTVRNDRCNSSCSVSTESTDVAHNEVNLGGNSVNDNIILAERVWKQDSSVVANENSVVEPSSGWVGWCSCTPSRVVV